MLCKSSLKASQLSCTCCHCILPAIVACDVSVSSMCLRRFWSRLKFGLRPVFFCTYEECNSHINLSGSPQGHPQFDILAAPCGMQVAHGHSIHAEAFTLLKFCRSTHPGIHSAAIMPSHSSIIISHTHPSSCSQSRYLRAHRQGQMRQCACALFYARSLSSTNGRTPEFLSLQSAALRCLTVRAVWAGRRIRMWPERTLCETALRNASAEQAAAARSRQLRRR